MSALWMMKPPFECVKSIKPDVFAKGQAYDEQGQEDS